MKTLYLSLSFVLLSVCGCAKQTYQAKPLESAPQQALAKINEKSIHSDAFTRYLIKQGVAETTLPLNVWNIDTLTYSALFHHPDLDVAKSELALAQSNIEIAGVKKRPTINSDLANTNQKNQDLKPWAYSIEVEIPIATNNKRELNIEKATHLAEAAKVSIAEIAWQLRQRLINDLLVYHQAYDRITHLEQSLATHQTIESIIQKRFDHGLASSVTLSKARLLAQSTKSNLTNEKSQLPSLIAKLAADAGISIAEFKKASIQPVGVSAAIIDHDQVLSQDFSMLQQAALINQLDLRKRLSQYAAAESQLKLEIAKQVPDISLRPGLAFEFGDTIWSLGFSSLLNFLKPYPQWITKAERLRDIEGAKFVAAQNNLINNLNKAYLDFKAAQSNLAQAKIDYAAQLKYNSQLEQQFSAGLIDRMDITQGQLNLINIKQTVSESMFALLKAQYAVENVIQKPLSSIEVVSVAQHTNVSE